MSKSRQQEKAHTRPRPPDEMGLLDRLPPKLENQINDFAGIAKPNVVPDEQGSNCPCSRGPDYVLGG